MDNGEPAPGAAPSPGVVRQLPGSRPEHRGDSVSGAASSRPTVTSSVDREWAAGWRVVASAGAGFSLSYGLFILSAGIFVVPMQAEFGWSRKELALGSFIVLLSSPMYLVAGWLVRKKGARHVALAGLVGLSALVTALSFAPASRPLIYGLVALMAVIGPLTSAPIYASGVTACFARHVGAALGVMLGTISLTAALVTPLLVAIVETHGWRTGYRTLAVLMLIAVPIVWRWFVPPRAERSEAGTGTGGIFVKDALRDPRLWLLTGAMACASAPLGGFLTQLLPILTDTGLPAAEAAVFVSAFAVSVGAGRLAGGFLLDRLPPSLVTTSCLLLPAAGCILLAMQGAPGATLAAIILVGLGQGAEVDFMAFYVAKLFGQRAYATILGVLVALNAIASAIGGILFAAVYDSAGRYHAALLASCAMFAISALLIAQVRLPPARLAARQAAG